MPEAEEVITDAARHATIFVRDLWRRHRHDQPGSRSVALRDVSERLALLTTAIFGDTVPIRAAQPPAPPTFLTKLFRRREGPPVEVALPATDGNSIWLPAQLALDDAALALSWYRMMAIQQAMRAQRQSAHHAARLDSALARDVFLLVEARAADDAIARLLPGYRAPLAAFRQAMLAMRPPLSRFPVYRRPLEALARRLLADEAALPAEDSIALARRMTDQLAPEIPPASRRLRLLHKDYWTGELLAAGRYVASSSAAGTEPAQQDAAVRSARLPRRPDVRKPNEDEDNDKPGAWMVQTSQPHEQAEDPIGLQRPTDRDESTAAEEYADSLSELSEARLVATPGSPKEVLLTDDLPDLARQRQAPGHRDDASSRLLYPEWDYRTSAYREPGACVHVRPAPEGPQAWVDRILGEYQSILGVIRRRFEMLRAQRVRLRKQLDGEDIDLDAYIEGRADFTAGLPMSQALYQSTRPAQRDFAIVLLIDCSGSTDAWITGNKRVIDVAREALLLVSIALQGMQAPYTILAFSGEGPGNVTVDALKTFDEPHSDQVARRIAALEPDRFTRAGAAIRHATAVLSQRPARHRLLLLLSDGKPNDIDEYEGRYGMEDTRQAIVEAKLQGINPFCLTVDRHASSYLPRVFGASHFALLPQPERLPTALLEWMKRLMAGE